MIPSPRGDEFLEVNSEENRLKLIEGLKDALAPVDFSELERIGILRSAADYRNSQGQRLREYEVLKPDALPQFVKRQALAVLTSHRSGSQVEILRFLDVPESFRNRLRKILKSLEHPTNSVADALERAGREFPILRIWPSATTSAQESEFWAPVLVYRALEAIADVGERYFNSSLMLDIEALVASWEFDYPPLSGEPRTFGERRFSRQVTLDADPSVASTLQIYFDLDDQDRRVHIGYCGSPLV